MFKAVSDKPMRLFRFRIVLQLLGLHKKHPFIF